MAKRLAACALSLLLCFVLSGCTGFTYQNINELLRAPALSGGLDAIQKALTDHLGGAEPQYKYPKEGDWRSPILQADLNGDGTAEAIVLYGLPDTTKSRYAHVALLEQVDGEWQVVQNLEGVASEVASLETADLLNDGTLQLVVGYSSAGNTLALYTYDGEVLGQAFQRAYSRYEIGDFTGRGGNDLVVVAGEPGANTLEYITSVDGQFITDSPPVALNSNLERATNIAPSLGADDGHLLVVDGTMNNNLMTFSQIVYYSGEHFYTVDDSGALREASARSNEMLLSRDIDDDGVVEIPINAGKAQTPSAEQRLEFIYWMDFITAPEEVVRQFGLMDSDRGLYIRVPEEWRGSLAMLDGEAKGEWRMQNERTRQTLLSIKVLEEGDTPPMNSQRVTGSVNSYLVYGGSLTAAEREIIAMTMLI